MSLEERLEAKKALLAKLRDYGGPKKVRIEILEKRPRRDEQEEWWVVDTVEMTGLDLIHMLLGEYL
jgi:hypothetical protein